MCGAARSCRDRFEHWGRRTRNQCFRAGSGQIPRSSCSAFHSPSHDFLAFLPSLQRRTPLDSDAESPAFHGSSIQSVRFGLSPCYGSPQIPSKCGPSWIPSDRARIPLSFPLLNSQKLHMKPPLSRLSPPSLQMWILLDPFGSRPDPAQLSPPKFTEAPYETTTFVPGFTIAANVDPPGSRRIPRRSRSAFPSQIHKGSI